MAQIKLWPEQAGKILEEVFGEGKVTAPLSYSPGKKGISYFAIHTDSERKVGNLKTLLKDICQIPAEHMLPAYSDTPLESNRGVLKLHIPGAIAEEVVTTLYNAKDQIEAFLNTVEPEIESPIQEEFRSRAAHTEKFGRPALNWPSVSPEKQAQALWFLEKGKPASMSDQEYEAITSWSLPPQNPHTSTMFMFNDAGRMVTAEGEQRQKLIEEYEAVCQTRLNMLDEKTPVDYLFNKETGEIDTLPAGTVYQKIVSGRTSQLEAATYWNPEEQRYYVREAERYKAQTPDHSIAMQPIIEAIEELCKLKV